MKKVRKTFLAIASSVAIIILGRIIRRASRAMEGVKKFRRVKLEYRERHTDIFIVTYPKSGTTWMQMIMHQLTSDGEMNFDHISRVSPYLEGMPHGDIPLETFASPRIIKSHLSYSEIPKTTARYIYVIRNGADVLVSYYHHLRHMEGFRLGFDEFFRMYTRGRISGSWAKHVSGWLNNKDRLNVLYVHYEDLIANLEGELRKIAGFCDLHIEESRYPAIVQRCSFSFMKNHEDKFSLLNQIFLDKGWDMNKFIRKGKTQEWKSYFSHEQLRSLEKEMEEYLDGQYLPLFLSRLKKGFSSTPVSDLAVN